MLFLESGKMIKSRKTYEHWKVWPSQVEIWELKGKIRVWRTPGVCFDSTGVGNSQGGAQDHYLGAGAGR